MFLFRSPDGQVLMVNSNDNYIRVFHIPDTVFNNQWDVNVELVGTETAEIRNGTQLMIRVKTGQRGVRVESGGWAWKWKNKSRKIISSACVCAFFSIFQACLCLHFWSPSTLHWASCKMSRLKGAWPCLQAVTVWCHVSVLPCAYFTPV